MASSLLSSIPFQKQNSPLSILKMITITWWRRKVQFRFQKTQYFWSDGLTFITANALSKHACTKSSWNQDFVVPILYFTQREGQSVTTKMKNTKAMGS